MVGVKRSLQAMVDGAITNYHRELKGEEPILMCSSPMFLGPPGTDKTTVGKLYGQVLTDISLLSIGECVIKNGSDFIAPYLGQSELFTKNILRGAKGKVLPIDEAYMINENQGGGSGKNFC
jgi:hypothetical protein